MLLSPILKYLSAGLAIAVLVLFVALKFEQRQSRKLSQRNTELVAKLESISTQKNEQRTTTGKNIAKANDRIVYVDRIAKQIEGAPLSGNCQTPTPIMEADL